jgi:hypothetical protein
LQHTTVADSHNYSSDSEFTDSIDEALAGGWRRGRRGAVQVNDCEILCTVLELQKVRGSCVLVMVVSWGCVCVCVCAIVVATAVDVSAAAVAYVSPLYFFFSFSWTE